MERSHDVVIIGGGVIGLTTAYYLAKEGARVAVIERGTLGGEASWAGAGILPPSNLAQARTPFDRLRGLSQRLFPGLTAELHELTGVDSGYWVCGGLEFAQGHMPGALQEEWSGTGVISTPLSEKQARELEPKLGGGLGPACHLPELAQVRNPHHLRALSKACLERGVAITTDTQVQGFQPLHQRMRAAVTSRGEVAADRFLLCAGAWSDELLCQLGWQGGIQPVRGQIALLNPGRPLLQHVLLYGAQYLVPRRDGRVLVGSTEEHVGFDKRTTAEAVAHLLNLAFHLVPALGEAEVEKTWAGLRPGSPDGLPYLGRAPGWENVFVGAGHFRAGLQLSTGSALLLKEMLLGQALSLDATPFRLDRVSRNG